MQYGKYGVVCQLNAVLILTGVLELVSACGEPFEFSNLGSSPKFNVFLFWFPSLLIPVCSDHIVREFLCKI
jgi:hypothetical protein